MATPSCPVIISRLSAANMLLVMTVFPGLLGSSIVFSSSFLQGIEVSKHTLTWWTTTFFRTPYLYTFVPTHECVTLMRQETGRDKTKFLLTPNGNGKDKPFSVVGHDDKAELVGNRTQVLLFSTLRSIPTITTTLARNER